MTELSDRATAILATLGQREKKHELPQLDAPNVGALLQQSRDQHLIYRRSIRHAVAGVVVQGNPVAADAAFRESARLRSEAELADPNHEDAAWVNDAGQKFPHAALLEWYQEQLNVK